MPNIRLTHPELSPNAAAAAAKVSPEIRELIKRSGKKPVREYTLGEEIFNAVTHGVGAGLAVAALVLLIVKSVADGGGILLAAALVYGIAQLLEYLMSTLYHALAAERAKRVFKVLDHSGIYLLIAGTYTPYCLITLGHVGGIWLAAFVWAVSLVGIAFEAFWLIDGNYAVHVARLVHRVLHPDAVRRAGPRRLLALGCRRHQLYRGRRVLHLQKGALHALDFSPVRAGRQLPAVLQRILLRDLALQLLGVRGAQGGDFAAPAGKIVLRRFQEEGQIA